MGDDAKKQPEKVEQGEKGKELGDKKADKKTSGEAVRELAAGKLNEQSASQKREQHKSGKSGVSGLFENEGNGGLPKAKDLFGDFAHKKLTKADEKNLDEMKSKSDTGMMMSAGGKFVQHEHKPAPDGRWHFQNPRVKPGQDIAGEIKEFLWNDAGNVPDAIGNSIGNTIKEAPSAVVNGAWAITEPVLKGLNEHMQQKPDMTYLEFVSGAEEDRGRSPLADVSFEGADKAYKEFPKLAQEGIPKSMISGIILNEVLHGGDQRDPLEDLQVKMFGTVRDEHGKEEPSVSVGPGQMQIGNIRHLVEKYPQLAEFKGDPIRAAVDPEKAPLFVAAYMCDKLETLENYNKAHSDKQIPLCAATLAYSYNPDVLSQNGLYRHTEASDGVGRLLHLHPTKGWHSENLPSNDEIVKHSKVIKDILSATKMVEDKEKAIH
jgi:hypothetical protein